MGGQRQEVPLSDIHSWSASARETSSQLHLHSVKSISTIHYGKSWELVRSSATRSLLWGPGPGSVLRAGMPQTFYKTRDFHVISYHGSWRREHLFHVRTHRGQAHFRVSRVAAQCSPPGGTLPQRHSP